MAKRPPEETPKTRRKSLTRHPCEPFRWNSAAACGLKFDHYRGLDGEHHGKPPLVFGPLARARVYALNHSGPRRSRCPATVPEEIARHPFARGPLRGVALAACMGSARFGLAASSCYPVRGARVQ